MILPIYCQDIISKNNTYREIIQKYVFVMRRFFRRKNQEVDNQQNLKEKQNFILRYLSVFHLDDKS